MLGDVITFVTAGLIGAGTVVVVFALLLLYHLIQDMRRDRAWKRKYAKAVMDIHEGRS